MVVCPVGGPMALERCPPAPVLPVRKRILERTLRRHPVLACTGALLLTGAGMLGAVTLVTFTAALPLAVLLGLV